MIGSLPIEAGSRAQPNNDSKEASMNDRMKEAFYAMLHIEDEDLDTMTPDQYESFLCFCRLCTPESREKRARMNQDDSDHKSARN